MTAGEPGYELQLIRDGLVAVRIRTRGMNLEVARPLCGELEELAADAPLDLVMDMRSLARATPRAGLYAFASLRRLPVRSMALFGATPFMRAFASSTMRAARFPQFSFFDDEEAALAWASAVGERQPEVGATRPGSPRRWPRAAAVAGCVLASSAVVWRGVPWPSAKKEVKGARSSATQGAGKRKENPR